MNTAMDVTAHRKHWATVGKTKPELVRLLARDCLGWSYVYAAAGDMCSPSTRRHYADAVKDKYPKYYSMIIDNCPALNGKGNCDNCKWKDTRCFDCRGFTRWIMSEAGIQVFGGGATTQWDTNSNWAVKGPISEMPRGAVCCIFKRKDGKMSHTGLHLGNAEIIHCSGTVKTDNLDTNSTWTHYGIPAGLYSTEVLRQMGIDASEEKNAPTLRRGTSGGDVRLLQDLLNTAAEKGFGHQGMPHLDVDGIFGAKTETAVKEFQSANHLTADGVVGPKTWKALEAYAPYSTDKADQVDIDNYGQTWDYLLHMTYNPYAVAGIMGNLEAESGINPENLESSGNRATGMTDAEYTKAVDDGTITQEQFVKLGCGYGICQWTYPTRKANLWNFAKNMRLSIGCLDMQLAFMLEELKERPSLFEKLRNATTVREASDLFMLEFEKPANTSEANREHRATLGQKILDRFGEAPEEKETAPEPEDVKNYFMIPAQDVQRLKDAAQTILDILSVYQ